MIIRVLKTVEISVLLAALVAFTGCNRSTESTGWVDRYNLGIAMLEQGEIKTAITEFEAALRADPGNFDILKNLAGAYAEDGNWDKSRTHYEQAIDIRPDDPSVYVNLAKVYLELGEPKLGWDTLAKAVDKDAAYPLAHFRAGELHMADGRTDEAIAAFSDYIAVEGDSALAVSARQIIDELRANGFSQPLVENILDTEIETEPEVIEETEIELLEEEPIEETETEPEIVVEEPEAVETPVEDEEPATPEEEVVVEGQPAEETPDEIDLSDLPDLEGDELYTDRLRRGRQMRAIGENDSAVTLLLEAYGVHPDYAQVNRELGLAYQSGAQLEMAKIYYEKYLNLETDSSAKVEIQSRLDAINAELGTEPAEESTDEEGDNQDEFEFF